MLFYCFNNNIDASILISCMIIIIKYNKSYCTLRNIEKYLRLIELYLCNKSNYANSIDRIARSHKNFLKKETFVTLSNSYAYSIVQPMCRNCNCECSSMEF